MCAENNVEQVEVMETEGKTYSGTFKKAMFVVASVWAGFAIGRRVTNGFVQRGLEQCFEHDPTLKEHMANTMAEITKKNLLRS